MLSNLIIHYVAEGQKMEDTHEIEAVEAQENLDNAPVKKQEARDEMLSRHR